MRIATRNTKFRQHAAIGVENHKNKQLALLGNLKMVPVVFLWFSTPFLN